MERKISQSLFSAFSRLAGKLRKGGLAGLVKILYRPFAGESLGSAIAGHRQIARLMKQPSMRSLNRKYRPGNKYLSPYLAKNFGKGAAPGHPAASLLFFWPQRRRPISTTESCPSPSSCGGTLKDQKCWRSR